MFINDTGIDPYLYEQLNQWAKIKTILFNSSSCVARIDDCLMQTIQKYQFNKETIQQQIFDYITEHFKCFVSISILLCIVGSLILDIYIIRRYYCKQKKQTQTQTQTTTTTTPSRLSIRTDDPITRTTNNNINRHDSDTDGYYHNPLSELQERVPLTNSSIYIDQPRISTFKLQQNGKNKEKASIHMK